MLSSPSPPPPLTVQERTGSNDGASASVVVTGACGGRAAMINGTYDVAPAGSGTCQWPRPFVKRGDPGVIMEYLRGREQWQIKPVSLRGYNAAWAARACVTCAAAALPNCGGEGCCQWSEVREVG